MMLTQTYQGVGSISNTYLCLVFRYFFLRYILYLYFLKLDLNLVSLFLKIIMNNFIKQQKLLG